MKVTTERTPECQAIVNIEIDEEQIKQATAAAARRVSRVRPIPGFRPGKAPVTAVERAVGKEALREEAIEELAQTVYKQVIKDENIDVYDAGKLDVAQKEPLVLKFTIPTRPRVKLGEYQSIHLKPREITVGDNEVDEVLQRFQQGQAEMTPVTRPVQMGDTLTVDVSGGIDGDAPNESKGLQVRMEKDKPVFPWIEQLVGMNPSETRSVSYSYPADDPNVNLAGKATSYTVTVTDIKETHLPPIDDELAKAVSQYENLDQFKGFVRNTLQTQKAREEDSRFADEVVDAVVGQSEIHYPSVMLDDELAQDTERSKQLAQRLGLTWDKYLSLTGKNEEQFREDQRPRAEQRLKRLLTLLELMEAEKIEVPSKEVDVEIDRRAEASAREGARADQTRRILSTPSARRDVEFNLKLARTIDRIVAMAKGEPTSGKIVTPEMVREEERIRQQALAQEQQARPSGNLITDPSQVRPADWPRGLDRPITPDEERRAR